MATVERILVRHAHLQHEAARRSLVALTFLVTCVGILLGALRRSGRSSFASMVASNPGRPF